VLLLVKPVITSSIDYSFVFTCSDRALELCINNDSKNTDRTEHYRADTCCYVITYVTSFRDDVTGDCARAAAISVVTYLFSSVWAAHR